MSRAATAIWGSSPRIRGKPVLDVAVVFGAGLIPAHTGKTTGAPEVPAKGWAHPRAYGENRGVPLLLRRRRGSSPRIRGKLLRNRRSGRVNGLIPAHTGKTVQV